MTTPASHTPPVLSVQNLDIFFKTPGGDPFHAVQNVSFDIHAGETLALVGESGSGKSITALSCLRLLTPAAQYGAQSRITLMGTSILEAREKDLYAVRGTVASMIFQEPLTALNPLHTIERQITENIRLAHPLWPQDQVRARVLDLLEMTELSSLADRLSAYPHELSGGQRQRVMIAMALASDPALLIADEPTTALDVTVQAEILDLLIRLQKSRKMALLMITHDLSIVRKMADRVCVMKKGVVVEQGQTASLFENPSHDYTKTLLSAHPVNYAPPPRDTQAPVILDGARISVMFPKKYNWLGRPISHVTAVDDISLHVRAGHTLGIVGESGSGKTTLALSLLRLLASTGTITLSGTRIDTLSSSALRPLRAKFQMVFQDPFGSLSPRLSVAQIVGEGLQVHYPHLSAAERQERIITALSHVQMDPDVRHRYPHEFSGGQRQRIALSRALVLRPDVILLDEPTSALDVVVQAEMIRLLSHLQQDMGLAYVFISHDLRVIRSLCHHVLVMKNGKMVEYGDTRQIFDAPTDPYTERLMAAALNLKAG